MFWNLAQYGTDITYNVGTGNETESAIAMAMVAPVLLFALAVSVLGVIALWRVFTKAGRPGWAAIVPIYNTWILAEICGKPGWWALLMFVPIANIIVTIILAMELAKKFGKSELWGLGLNWFLSPIGQMILGFGSASYEGGGPVLDGPVAPVTPAPVAPAGPISAQESFEQPIAQQVQPVVSGEVDSKEGTDQPTQPPQYPQGPIIQG